MGLNKESGLKIGRGTPGPRNLITDVPGVTVGQKVRLYGVVDGDFPIVNENKSFPRCELIFFESAE